LQPIRVIVVDDEPPAREAIRMVLAGMPEVEVMEDCGDAASAVSAIKRLMPDLVLLDIQMPDADGFDVIDAVGADAMPPVVFVTAYDYHALRAFEVHALDYVLKPFGDARLRDAVTRARRWIAAEAGDWQNALRSVLDDMSAGAARRYARRLLVRRDESLVFIRTEQIDWIEASRNKMLLHLGDHVFEIRSTLKALVERLDPSRFVQIHRSTVVNVDRIAEIQPWFAGDHLAILVGGKQLRVSRTFRDRLFGATG
jgi:two-component system LytT family response regulator